MIRYNWIKNLDLILGNTWKDFVVIKGYYEKFNLDDTELLIVDHLNIIILELIYYIIIQMNLELNVII